jgi:hypothetical protein
VTGASDTEVYVVVATVFGREADFLFTSIYESCGGKDAEGPLYPRWSGIVRCLLLGHERITGGLTMATWSAGIVCEDDQGSIRRRSAVAGLKMRTIAATALNYGYIMGVYEGWNQV